MVREPAGAIQIGRAGSIEVLAEWQGEEYLKPYLKVSVTADADGNFQLGGLTSGNYVVQAALDSIWLSAPILVHARPSETSPIELKIPLPGAAVCAWNCAIHPARQSLVAC